MLKHLHQSIARQTCSIQRCLPVLFFLLLVFARVQAIPLNEYHQRLRLAVTGLDSLVQVSENEDTAAYDARRIKTLDGIRSLLPPAEQVQWNDTTINVDNSWLSPELDKVKTASGEDRTKLIKATAERLQALEERVAQIEKPDPNHATNKDEAKRRLAEILKRPEYERKVQHESALERLLKRLYRWFQDLFPKPKPISPGTAGWFSRIAEIFVIVLALAVLAFVAKLVLPHFLRRRGSKKKEKARARIVLGEKLDPDQSAVDLLSEAEMLARRGELRAAIRKAYIALLVELGDRKIISLAQYKTNRDYLRSVRELQPLYGNVKQLTESFERHWYGLAQATETDWMAFRSAYEQTLQR